MSEERNSSEKFPTALEIQNFFNPQGEISNFFFPGIDSGTADRFIRLTSQWGFLRWVPITQIPTHVEKIEDTQLDYEFQIIKIYKCEMGGDLFNDTKPGELEIAYKYLRQNGACLCTVVSEKMSSEELPKAQDIQAHFNPQGGISNFFFPGIDSGTADRFIRLTSQGKVLRWVPITQIPSHVEKIEDTKLEVEWLIIALCEFTMGGDFFKDTKPGELKTAYKYLRQNGACIYID